MNSDRRDYSSRSVILFEIKFYKKYFLKKCFSDNSFTAFTGCRGIVEMKTWV